MSLCKYLSIYVHRCACAMLVICQAPAYCIRIKYNIKQHDESECKTSVSYPTSSLPLSECTALFQEDKRTRGQEGKRTRGQEDKMAAHCLISHVLPFFLVQFVVAQLVKKFCA